MCGDGTADGASRARMVSCDGKVGVVGGAGRAGGAANSLNPPIPSDALRLFKYVKKRSSNIFIRQYFRSRSSIWYGEV